MMDSLTSIIVALIEQKQIADYNDPNANIQEISKAIKEIGKTLYEVNSGNFNK